MTALLRETTGQTLRRRFRSPAAWGETADLFAILTVASLPWSTSLTAIFNAVFLVCIVPFLELKAFLRSLTRPICAAPIALVLLALIGTLWSDAAWGQRLHAVSPTVKLLVLPVLLYHFERSQRGHWMFVAFLASCAILAVMSWLVVLYPGLSLRPYDPLERGIFVKNYIDQSQEFTLCAVALAYPVMTLLREQRYWLAGLLTLLALSFVANMAFVVISRTALVTMPIMLGMFGLLHLRGRSVAVITVSLLALAAIAWQASPQLRRTADTFSQDYQLYMQKGIPTSMGERLEYWRHAVQFFVQAPLKGHGTGSTQGLFERASTDPSWIPGVRVFPNPHNQTLHVAVQWGLMGIVVLYTIWILHLMLFWGDGLACWIGMLVVVQNIFTSLFNSHLFDFHEGWMYVIGVGVAGGIVNCAKQKPMEARSEYRRAAALAQTGDP
ncbi:O-antigen ligase family protein [Bradyrhizobium sp. WYCCWR 12699]|uniref:O-antigen ligase family protein n=1 Tax=Bradyrhizobium sp. WYCCWR 12699 TaxID=3064203 RepID=UPI0028A45E4E|nr:O-antigen ligase family protein [Bradyrhizobium sp. WYCCWR 12699]MDT4740723.1 O-antigen ligase family protein [Bradyrhizobium sp. WYCCWR 12699]